MYQVWASHRKGHKQFSSAQVEEWKIAGHNELAQGLLPQLSITTGLFV